MRITTLGIDLAKSVFQLHGVDETGVVVLRRKLRRAALLAFLSELPACRIGMEACASAHDWARRISAMGHDVRLIPPAYVKPYVKRQKNDAADAEAICEAVLRPGMANVPIKSAEQQGCLVLHRSRDLLMRQRTMLLNAIRAHLSEFGIVLPQGPARIIAFMKGLRESGHPDLPDEAAMAITVMSSQLDALEVGIHAIERKLLAWHRDNAVSQRLETIPGVGLITATALAASVSDPEAFRSGRHFAAFLGLVPRQNSSGGKERLGHITKMGNGYLRRLLVIGATSVVRRAGASTTRTGEWLRGLLERKPARLVTVAMANKTARIAWAVMAHGRAYRAA
ncbi:MAG: IS110 family transposase [Hyphomicrobiales bacterium]|jgi:transposase|nr:IS110 family transposase [Hyphomicrobiales bacterium]MCZ8280592.1 IS110 family transposase [Acetobacteraceae bacterium]